MNLTAIMGTFHFSFAWVESTGCRLFAPLGYFKRCVIQNYKIGHNNSTTLAHKGTTLARKGTTLARKGTTGKTLKPYGFLYGCGPRASSNHYSLVRSLYIIFLNET